MPFVAFICPNSLIYRDHSENKAQNTQLNIMISITEKLKTYKNKNIRVMRIK